ncbi:MAG: FmdB family zinc ribbon protein [bacterium]
MPLYEYRCRKCGSTSGYLEKIDQFHWFGVKCKHCGSRKTDRVLSTFRASVSRSQAEVLNDLKAMGNVRFTQQQGPAPLPVSEDGSCPNCGASDPTGGGGGACATSDTPSA